MLRGDHLLLAGRVDYKERIWGQSAGASRGVSFFSWALEPYVSG